MHLHEWLNHHYKTDILRFEHLDEYVQATPEELEACIELINPWYNILLKSSDGVKEMNMMDSLERNLLRQFGRKKRMAKITLEIDVELLEEALTFSQKEKARVIEKVTHHMQEQGIKEWRIVRMQKI
ncbi:hypothetical protein [Exiguobacterium sp. AB2]|uniref:hypothetical protein n=1 Tax=Exiguobacterium sp. AB2 TaxID=1484479 RepID=UPI0004A96AD2|nr:hypothetical protein [Exiguobacterium sp. AB2]KDN57627.1 hypothetical protein DI14_10490 [Exiguobacterium sp. AB2]